MDQHDGKLAQIENILVSVELHLISGWITVNLDECVVLSVDVQTF